MQLNESSAFYFWFCPQSERALLEFLPERLFQSWFVALQLFHIHSQNHTTKSCFLTATQLNLKQTFGISCIGLCRLWSVFIKEFCWLKNKKVKVVMGKILLADCTIFGAFCRMLEGCVEKCVKLSTFFWREMLKKWVIHKVMHVIHEKGDKLANKCFVKFL